MDARGRWADRSLLGPLRCRRVRSTTRRRRLAHQVTVAHPERALRQGMAEPTGREPGGLGDTTPRREWAKALVFVIVVGALTIGLVIWLAFNVLSHTCACG